MFWQKNFYFLFPSLDNKALPKTGLLLQDKIYSIMSTFFSLRVNPKTEKEDKNVNGVHVPVRHIFLWYLQFHGTLKIAIPDLVCHIYDIILTVLSDCESKHKFVNNELHCY